MAQRRAFHAAALGLWSILPYLLVLRAEVGQPREESLYLWIDAHQARVLIGFEEDILIVSEGKMAPFTHDFRKAQQRMPAIPVNIHSMNFTWQAAGQREKERKRKERNIDVREKHQLDASQTLLIGDQTHNPDMCPDQESNWRPLTLQDDVHPTEPYQSELRIQILIAITAF